MSKRRHFEDPEKVLLKRTRTMIDNHRRRADPVELDYDLADLRRLVREAMPVCPYCRGELTQENFSADHATPIGRGGTFARDNVVICCQDCNTAKGPLTTEEWYRLVDALRAFHPEARKNTLARLKAGASKAKMARCQSARPSRP